MNIPENRFGVVDGEIVYADENGDLQRAVPSYTGGGLKSCCRAHLRALAPPPEKPSRSLSEALAVSRGPLSAQ